jgi:methyl-accepting chemotaxis protein
MGRHMKAQKSMIPRILSAVTGVVILVFVVFAIILDNQQSSHNTRQIEQNITSTGNITAEAISNWFAGQNNLLTAAAQAIASASIPEEGVKLLDEAIYKNSFMYTYLGTAAGKMMMFPNDPLPDGYDPRVRPWYKDAVATAGMTITLPYEDASTKQTVLTAALPVVKNDKTIGVVGGDFSLTTLFNIVSGITLPGNGRAFVIHENGTILIHEDTSLVGKNVRDIYKGDYTFTPTVHHAEMHGTPHLINFTNIPKLPAVKWYVGIEVEETAIMASVNKLRWSVLISTLIAAILLMGVMYMIIKKTVAAPIQAITKTMGDLARGNLNTVFPRPKREDEISAMVRAVEVFRDNARIQKDLEAQQAADQQRRERRAQRIEEMVSNLDAEIAQIIGTVSSASTELEATAQTLSDTARGSAQNATSVAAASEEASVNVQTVAQSSSNLATSINDIMQRVNASLGIAARASTEATRTDKTVRSLVDATDRVTQILDLITDIASQTNLLALNATIEAARAGEAGKGFNVVANEVKNLANQTARATEDIASQIQTMQSISGEAAQAIKAIAEIIQEINTISEDISQSVRNQEASTGEIAQSVEEAAKGTQEVSHNVVNVTRSAQETGDSANQVLNAAQELAENSERLKRKLDQFFTDIRSM